MVTEIQDADFLYCGVPKALSTLFSSYHSYCQELMKSVGSHGSSLLLFMMKMMV
jgi:hypothetical protein